MLTCNATISYTYNDDVSAPRGPVDGRALLALEKGSFIAAAKACGVGKLKAAGVFAYLHTTLAAAGKEGPPPSNNLDILSRSGIPARMVTDPGEQPQQHHHRRPVRLLSGPLSQTESDLLLRQLSEHDVLSTSSIPLRQNSNTSRDTEHSHRGGVHRTSSEV